MMNKAIDVDVIPVETACPICGHEYTAVFADHELAQLRADLQAAQERSAEQARQLDAARNIISAYRALPTGPKGYTSYPLFDLHNAADEWLAVNPAPQAEQP